MLVELPCKVRTTGGVTLELVRELGTGGQGSVYEVADGRHAVKLLKESTPDRAREWVRRLEAVRRLPIDGLPLARPIDTVVAPCVGYVMEIVGGMVPFSSLTDIPAGVRSVEHYRDTGGLRRRLRLLARTAEVLAALHARGLVYQDPSPRNIFISSSVDREQVWLIDTDNLSYGSVGDAVVCTPRYSAPELRGASRRPANSLSDAFAFVVIAFEALTLDHPFIGDDLYYASEEAAEAAALDGSHPWVDRPDDPSNVSTRGIQPRHLVLNEALWQLFHSTFVDGLRGRDRRPGVGRWTDVLREAAAMTVVCPACDMTYYFDETVDRCPWCEDAARPATLEVWVYLDLFHETTPATPDLDAEAHVLERGQLVIAEGQDVCIPRGAVFGSVADPGRVLLQVHWRHERLLIQNHADHHVELVSSDGQRTNRLGAGQVVDIPARVDEPMWSVRLARENRQDRWLCFRVNNGGAP